MYDKKLIVYFSESGNTKKLAEMIQAAVGGELRAISDPAPDLKAYALRFAGIMGLVSIGPLAAGIAGLIYDNKRAAIALIVGMVFSLWGATQLIKKVT